MFQISSTKSTVNLNQKKIRLVLVMLKMLFVFAISCIAFGVIFSVMYILWNFTPITVANRNGIKTREESFPVGASLIHTHTHTHAHTHTHRHLQTHKGRHYLEAMDHVNGILSTLWECGRCFSAWLRRLSSGTVCTTNSIYFIFRDEDGRLERVNISVCLSVCLCASCGVCVRCGKYNTIQIKNFS